MQNPTLRQSAEQALRLALDNPQAKFRDGQWEAIAELVERRARLLVVQRTGWGKSVVYFIAIHLLRDRGAGPTLLISPLLALMRNQIEMANRLGVRAATINSSNAAQWQAVRNQLLHGEVDVLLVSPERLANDQFREETLLPIAANVGLFVVDEAHCISDWGHDFRPDYLRITRILQALPPNIPVLATTATANNRVVEDIQAQLGPGLRIARGPLARDSLRLQNIRLPSQAARMAWLAEHLPQMPGTGIIYTLTIRDAQRVADWLRSQGIDAAAYWGDLDHEERIALEERLLGNQIKALVATTALGMGFDKPDLGFVIHFQRPGSVVHYYQQVGRAGRALEHAYGIMLSGVEDDEITDYFIRTAFPPQAHTEEVLEALADTEDGLSLPALESHLNLRRGQIEKVLKILAVETPAPVVKMGSRWYATPVPYAVDRERIERLTEIRRQEQARMAAYLGSQQCLMEFLRRELDDPQAGPCRKCAVCLGRPLVAGTYSREKANQAVQFLRGSEQIIEPRKQWPGDALASYGWRGNIAPELRAQEGRALCLWGDAGWGELVRQGKQVTGTFSDELVGAVVEMLRIRWRPEPFPSWVTCIPSLRSPRLVPDFARKVATALSLPFVPCVEKVKATAPQKGMENSYQQAKNLESAFRVQSHMVRGESMLLIDDMVDSRWTFTVIAALLRGAGAGPVFPLALAMTTPAE